MVETPAWSETPQLALAIEIRPLREVADRRRAVRSDERGRRIYRPAARQQLHHVVVPRHERRVLYPRVAIQDHADHVMVPVADRSEALFVCRLCDPLPKQPLPRIPLL